VCFLILAMKVKVDGSWILKVHILISVDVEMKLNLNIILSKQEMHSK